MTPHFADWAAFWHMGGYAPYVWASYGLTALVLAAVMLQPLWRRRALLAAERRRQRADARADRGVSGR